MKKASLAVALVLVFGLFATAFSLAPAFAQTNATSTTTSNASSTAANATKAATNATTAAAGSTFSAKGTIAALLFQTVTTTTTTPTNATKAATNATTAATNATTAATPSNATTMTTTTIPKPWLLSGNWSLNVQNGKVSNFTASFTMIHTDGTGRHTQGVSSFKSSDGATISLDRNGSTFIFGTSDVSTGGAPKWTGVNTLIIIDRLNAFTISFESSQTDNHFLGQPITGVVESLKDQTGKELIQTGAPSPQETKPTPSNATTATITTTPSNATTTTTSNATKTTTATGNATTTTTSNKTTAGNQTSGGFLGTLSKLFGGGNQTK